MIRPSSARPAIALAMSIIALGALATPVAAGPGTTTRWVDDDGHAGPTGCGGSKTAKSTIQSAVNASDTNDVVIVCPGTYEEHINIDGARNGLTVRGFSKWTAVVRAPNPAEDALILVDGVDMVTIQGLKLVFPTSCEEPVDELDGIEGVDADSLTVRGNHLRATGDDTLGVCGYADGVQVSSSDNVLVHSNLIRDFQSDGVRFDGTVGTISGNSIRFYHLGEPDDGFDEGNQGIDIVNGRATVTSNVVRSIPGGGDSGPNLGTGILVDVSPGSIVRNNTVIRALFGTEVLSSGDTPVRNNEFRGFGQGAGIDVGDGSGSVIRNNLVRNFENGIHTTAGGNVFRDNDSANNESQDCLDETSGSGTDGTDNTWVDNLGHPADPDGICDQLT